MTMHIKNSLVATVSAALALGCTSVTQAQQVATAAVETQARAPAPMAALPVARFRATLVSVEANTLRFLPVDAKEPRLVTFTAEQIKSLGPIKGRAFGVVAVERPTPAGIASAVVLRDERGLFAIVERVTEVPLLRLIDRGGIQIESVPTGPRTFVYDTSCKTVYYVPAKVTVGGKSYVVKAYETRTIEIDKLLYELSVRDSTVTVLKPCNATYEGSRLSVDYSLVRK
jgi:hypothetical protein